DVIFLACVFSRACSGGGGGQRGQWRICSGGGVTPAPPPQARCPHDTFAKNDLSHGQRFVMVKDDSSSGRLHIGLNSSEELKSVVSMKWYGAGLRKQGQARFDTPPSAGSRRSPNRRLAHHSRASM